MYYNERGSMYNNLMLWSNFNETIAQSWNFKKKRNLEVVGLEKGKCLIYMWDILYITVKWPACRGGTG